MKLRRCCATSPGLSFVQAFLEIDLKKTPQLMSSRPTSERLAGLQLPPLCTSGQLGNRGLSLLRKLGSWAHVTWHCKNNPTRVGIMSLATLLPKGWAGSRLGPETTLAIISLARLRNSGNTDMCLRIPGYVSRDNVLICASLLLCAGFVSVCEGAFGLR